MKQKHIKLAVLSGAVFLAPALAQAEWYVGAGGGMTNVQTERWSVVNTSSAPYSDVIDDSDSSFKVFAGWKATPALALEFGYADLGQYTESFSSGSGSGAFHGSGKLEANALFGELVGSMDLGSNWSFLGKVGISYWDAKMSYSDNIPFSDSGSKKKLNPVIGAGFEYAFSKESPLALRLEWEQYQNVGEEVAFKTDTTTTHTLNGQDINVMGVSLTYRFR